MRALLFSCLLATVFPVSPLTAADVGLFDLLDEAHPKPLQDHIGLTTLHSVSNDNKRYYLDIHADPSFSLPCQQIGLIVGRKTIRFNAQGHDAAGRNATMSTIIEDPELIPLIAEHFHAPVQRRSHPGHQLLVRFIPERTEYKPGEAVTKKGRFLVSLHLP